MPERVQLSREKGWRMPANTVKVDRTNKRLGNPYNVGSVDPVTGRTITPELAVTLFKFLWAQTAFRPVFAPLLAEIRGKNLACWCKRGEPCHADVLLELANAEPDA
ncbi:MAG: hypothetical protein CL472_06115 [Acidobacteria bacterium]|nr:hypothetical protein [Acidobacteriota bacterium]